MSEDALAPSDAPIKAMSEDVSGYDIMTLKNKNTLKWRINPPIFVFVGISISQRHANKRLILIHP